MDFFLSFFSYLILFSSHSSFLPFFSFLHSFFHFYFFKHFIGQWCWLKSEVPIFWIWMASYLSVALPGKDTSNCQEGCIMNCTVRRVNSQVMWIGVLASALNANYKLFGYARGLKNSNGAQKFEAHLKLNLVCHKAKVAEKLIRIKPGPVILDFSVKSRNYRI